MPLLDEDIGPGQSGHIADQEEVHRRLNFFVYAPSPTGVAATDTTNLQAALDEAEDAVVVLKAGTYVLNAALNIIGNRVEIRGAGRYNTVIQQNTADTPIIKQTNSIASGGGTNGLYIRDLALVFEDAPTSGTTQQYAVQFRPNAAGDTDDGGGYYHVTFRDIRIEKAYVGVGTYTTGTAHVPVWGALFDNIQMTDIIRSAIKLDGGNASATAVGQPMVTVRHLSVDGTGTTLGPCIDLVGVRGFVSNTVNIEDWHNEALKSTSGGAHTLHGWRLERHKATGSTPTIFHLANGQFDIAALDAEVIQDASTYARLLYVLGGAQARASALNIERSASSSTSNQLGVCMGDPTDSTIILNSCELSGTAFVEYLVSGWGSDLYVRTQVDGKAPVVDAFPAAGAGYRGRHFRTEGGAGVADTQKVCLKDGADAYNWVAIT